MNRRTSHLAGKARSQRISLVISVLISQQGIWATFCKATLATVQSLEEHLLLRAGLQYHDISYDIDNATSQTECNPIYAFRCRQVAPEVDRFTLKDQGYRQCDGRRDEEDVSGQKCPPDLLVRRQAVVKGEKG